MSVEPTAGIATPPAPSQGVSNMPPIPGLIPAGSSPPPTPSVNYQPVIPQNPPQTATPTPNPTTQTAPNTAQASQDSPRATPDPSVVQLHASELETLRAAARRVSEIDARERETARQAEEARIAELARSGQVTEALNQQRAAYQREIEDRDRATRELQEQIARDRLEATVSTALVGRTFVGNDEHAQATTGRLLRADIMNRLECVRDASGQFVSRERGTNRPADEAIRDYLASPSVQQLFAARPVSGVNPHAGSLPTPGQPQTQSWLERNAAAYKAGMQNNGSIGIRMM